MQQQKTTGKILYQKISRNLFQILIQRIQTSWFLKDIKLFFHNLLLTFELAGKNHRRKCCTNWIPSIAYLAITNCTVFSQTILGVLKRLYQHALNSSEYCFHPKPSKLSLAVPSLRWQHRYHRTWKELLHTTKVSGSDTLVSCQTLLLLQQPLCKQKWGTG